MTARVLHARHETSFHNVPACGRSFLSFPLVVSFHTTCPFPPNEAKLHATMNVSSNELSDSSSNDSASSITAAAGEDNGFRPRLLLQAFMNYYSEQTGIVNREILEYEYDCHSGSYEAALETYRKRKRDAGEQADCDYSSPKPVERPIAVSLDSFGASMPDADFLTAFSDAHSTVEIPDTVGASGNIEATDRVMLPQLFPTGNPKKEGAPNQLWAPLHLRKSSGSGQCD